MPKKKKRKEAACLVEAADKMRVEAKMITDRLREFLMKDDPLRAEAATMLKAVTTFRDRLAEEFPESN